MNSLRDAPALAAVLAGALSTSAAAAPGGSANTYYERSLMVAADARCGLFAPNLASALHASQAQARGAALRAGAGRAALDEADHRALARAYSLSCDSPDLKRAADRVRDAFEGYARLWRMTFPGEAASWTADRAAPSDRAPGARWAVSQGAAGGVVLGLAAERQGRSLTAVFPGADAARASSARLVMRDPRLAPEPYLDTRAPGLAGKAAPKSASRVWLASGRGPAPQGLAVGSAEAFRFPDAAIEALEALDPRETVVVELVFPDAKGERVSRSLFEVGDFAAARAFLAAR